MAPDTSPLGKKNLIFGRNELSFRELQYLWMILAQKKKGSDFFQ